MELKLFLGLQNDQLHCAQDVFLGGDLILKAPH